VRKLLGGNFYWQFYFVSALGTHCRNIMVVEQRRIVFCNKFYWRAEVATTRGSAEYKIRHTGRESEHRSDLGEREKEQFFKLFCEQKKVLARLLE